MTLQDKRDIARMVVDLLVPKLKGTNQDEIITREVFMQRTGKTTVDQLKYFREHNPDCIIRNGKTIMYNYTKYMAKGKTLQELTK